MKLTRTVLKADIPSATSGYIYPKSVLKSIVKKEKHKIKAGLSFGTLGLPENADLNLCEVSHRITDLKLIDDELICEVELLDNPFGNKVKDMISNGEEFTIKPAGLGKLNNNVVQSRYDLISLNLVNQSKVS